MLLNISENCKKLLKSNVNIFNPFKSRGLYLGAAFIWVYEINFEPFRKKRKNPNTSRGL